MAFLNDLIPTPDDEEKKVLLAKVGQYRDQLWDANQDKPMKIIIAAVIGGWLIYHFLIKR